MGLLGDIGCFSFYPVKHITTGEGGMVITTREDVAERVSKQRAFGIDKSVLADRRHTGAYEIERLGLQLPARRDRGGDGRGADEAAAAASSSCASATSSCWRRASAGSTSYGCSRPGTTAQRRSSHYCLVAVLDEELRERREQIIEQLKADGVGTSVYYPKPLPDTRFYRETYGDERGLTPRGGKHQLRLDRVSGRAPRRGR